MQTTQNINFRCPNCGFQTGASVTTIIDVAENPQAKAQLLQGALNVIQCPNCSTPSTASTPMVYHDASKETLITFVPMAMNMPEQEADKMLGSLINEVTSNMDQKLVKGYIFQPKRALTMQGFLEQILETDGITKEMQEEQRERARLAQMFLQTDPETFEDLVQEHDDKIDEQFFTTLSMIAQQTAQQGRGDMAEYVLGVQQRIAELSTAGKELLTRAEEQQALLEEVATQLQGLGEQPTPDDVVELVAPYGEDTDRLQAFVGLARPIFDYHFFEALTKRIASADDEERARLESLRDNIMGLTQVIDQQQQSEMQAAAELLREIMNAPDLDEAIRQHMGNISETFMAVLELNINEAEKQGDIAASSKLKEVREHVVAALQSNMRPDVRFINNLLAAESQTDAQALIQAEAPEHGPEVLETFDALMEVIAAQGQTEIVQRLQLLKEMTAEVVEA